MDREAMLERVARLGGLDTAESAEHAIVAVARALRPSIGDEDARALAKELPEPAATALLGPPGGDGEGKGGEGLYVRVGRLENVAPGFAVEHTQVVCRVLGEALPEAERERLRGSLPAELGALLGPRNEPGNEPPPRGSEASLGGGSTLATGRPGSRHPLSEARPERAHEQSVARSDNPHADTKISSARGLRQESAEETLATGRPGSRKPISRSG